MIIPGWPSPTDSEVNRILSLLAVSENAVPESAEGILRKIEKIRKLEKKAEKYYIQTTLEPF